MQGCLYCYCDIYSLLTPIIPQVKWMAKFKVSISVHFVSIITWKKCLLLIWNLNWFVHKCHFSAKYNQLLNVECLWWVENGWQSFSETSVISCEMRPLFTHPLTVISVGTWRTLQSWGTRKTLRPHTQRHTYTLAYYIPNCCKPAFPPQSVYPVFHMHRPTKTEA